MRPKFLSNILGQRSKVETLRCLFSVDGELTGREIARRTGLSHPIVHKALEDLETEKVVTRRVSPPTHQFRLNKDLWVVREVLGRLFEQEENWMKHLTQIVAKNLPETVMSVVLFGSAVKGKMAPESDVDVLVLVDGIKQIEEVRDRLSERGRKIYSSFGHPLVPLICSLEEFRKNYKSGQKFAKEISYTGRTIYGKLLTEALFEHGA
ncbi:MAG: nucleotidyltransferase domain-containing protein [Elusimicrobia bacterium]|nr:nucleotidyltransferase domain-containing protein [Elusimicrobiota bacterium]